MKAIQYRTFGGPEVLEYVELPEPEPGPGDVLIETVGHWRQFPGHSRTSWRLQSC